MNVESPTATAHGGHIAAADQAPPSVQARPAGSSSRGWVDLASFAAAVPVAVVGLSFVDPTRGRLDDFALGAGTTSVFEWEAGHLIHGSQIDDVSDVIAGHEARGAGDVVLWLGNSQLHAINQHHDGEETAVALAYRALAPNGIDLVGFSQPNASLQEHYVLFEYLAARLPVKILVLPLVFDDTPETGIRAGLAGALEAPPTMSALARSQAGRAILASGEGGTLAGGDMAGLADTVQESVERSLDGWLSAHARTWRARPQLRGDLFTSVYRLRNTVLGIRPTSKRRIIIGRYQANLLALDATLSSARRSGTEVILYITPLRDDVPPPYVAAEYRRFRADVRRLAVEHGARLRDLEHLVPASLWGEKRSTSAGGGLELDFMHFQEGGHELLAGAIAAAVRDTLRGGPR